MRCFLLEKMHGTITSKKCLPLANTEQSFEWYSKCKRWLYFSWETQNWRMFIKSSHRHRCYARSIVPIGATCLFHLLYVANDNLWPSASCFFFSTLRPRGNLGRKRCHGLFSLKHDPWNRNWSKESSKPRNTVISHIIHVWHIYTHLAYFYGKCR